MNFFISLVNATRIGGCRRSFLQLPVWRWPRSRQLVRVWHWLLALVQVESFDSVYYLCTYWNDFCCILIFYIAQRVIFVSRRFGTPCPLHLLVRSDDLRSLRPRRWNRQSVPKRRPTNITLGNMSRTRITHSDHGKSFKARFVECPLIFVHGHCYLGQKVLGDS